MSPLLLAVDPRLQDSLRSEWKRREHERVEGIARGVTVVLAGHRAAGKSTVLPEVARILQRPAYDLDRVLAERTGKNLKHWVETDEPGFREAERAHFTSLPPGSVVAVGGGFLSLHGDLLTGVLVVEVPISFETYVERLSADTTRGRLRPDLPLAEELRTTYETRSRKHAVQRPLAWVDFVLRLHQEQRARRVVTLPPGLGLDWVKAAKRQGAEVVELRDDLHGDSLDVTAIAEVLPVLLAHRTGSLPSSWIRHAHLVDQPHDLQVEASLRSWHSDRPLTPDQALAGWAKVDAGGMHVKHVEPLGEPESFPRLLETQRRLVEAFGAQRVTVLATGPWALPFRAALAQRNALDYLALDSSWSAAPGQRLLADAVRAGRGAHPSGRLGILGSNVGHSRSPRVHRAPFDRIQLPVDAPLERILEALKPHYRGFAVTNPFKKRVATYAKASLAAVNTLVRRGMQWETENSDVLGAVKVLARLPPGRVSVLGDGGVTEAIRRASEREVQVLTRRDCDRGLTVEGAVVWTWPPDIEAPEGLRFERATVAIVAYGPGARRIEREILRRGGRPLRLGARWFIAQARRQRELWETAA